MIKEINGRWTCTKCGYEWSGMMSDCQIPDKCECEKGKQKMKKQKVPLEVVQDVQKLARVWTMGKQNYNMCEPYEIRSFLNEAMGDLRDSVKEAQWDIKDHLKYMAHEKRIQLEELAELKKVLKSHKYKLAKAKKIVKHKS